MKNLIAFSLLLMSCLSGSAQKNGIKINAKEFIFNSQTKVSSMLDDKIMVIKTTEKRSEFNKIMYLTNYDVYLNGVLGYQIIVEHDNYLIVEHDNEKPKEHHGYSVIVGVFNDSNNLIWRFDCECKNLHELNLPFGKEGLEREVFGNSLPFEAKVQFVNKDIDYADLLEVRANKHSNAFRYLLIDNKN